MRLGHARELVLHLSSSDVGLTLPWPTTHAWPPASLLELTLESEKLFGAGIAWKSWRSFWKRKGWLEVSEAERRLPLSSEVSGFWLEEHLLL